MRFLPTTCNLRRGLGTVPRTSQIGRRSWAPISRASKGAMPTPCVCMSGPFGRLATTASFRNEALANELAANFYAALGFETISHAYLRNARSCYLRWEADGKVRQMDEANPHLRQQLALSQPAATIGVAVDQADLGTVITAAQAVSGEIVSTDLLKP